jgi:hypothetical protein
MSQTNVNEEEALAQAVRRRQAEERAKSRVLMAFGGFTFGLQGDTPETVAWPVPTVSEDGRAKATVPTTFIQTPEVYKLALSNQLVDRSQFVEVAIAGYVGTIDEIMAMVRAQLEAAATTICELDHVVPMVDNEAAQRTFSEMTGYRPGQATCFVAGYGTPWLRKINENRRLGAAMIQPPEPLDPLATTVHIVQPTEGND